MHRRKKMCQRSFAYRMASEHRSMKSIEIGKEILIDGSQASIRAK